MTAYQRITEVAAGQFATRRERQIAIAAARAEEMAKFDHALRIDSGDLGIEIESITRTARGIDVFARAWKGKDQIGFGHDGSVDVERFHIGNPPLLVPDPSGDIVRTVSRRGDVIKHVRYREDPVEALRSILLGVVRDVGKPGAEIVKGKRGRTTYTLFSQNDGSAARVGSDYSTVRNGGGTLSFENTASFGQYDTGSGIFRYQVYQALLEWDTSGVAGGISSVTMSIMVSFNDTATDFTAEARIHSYGTASQAGFVAGDDLASMTLVASRSTAGIVDEAYMEFTSEAAFLSNIGASVTQINVSSSRQRAGSTPAGSEAVFCVSSAESGTSQDPRLVIETFAAGYPKIIIF